MESREVVGDVVERKGLLRDIAGAAPAERRQRLVEDSLKRREFGRDDDN
jgi:hypothetical protein